MLKFSIKLRLALILVAIVPLLTLGWIISSLNEKTLRMQAQSYYLLAAERVQDRINTYILERVNVLSQISSTLGNSKTTDANEAIMNELRQILVNSENVDAIGLYDVNGSFVDALVKKRGNHVPIRLPARDLFLISSKATFALMPVQQDSLAKMPYLPLVVPIYNNQQKLGYCSLSIRTEDLCDIVEQYSRRIFAGASDRVLIVTDSLRLIASNNRNSVAFGETSLVQSPLVEQKESAFVGTIREYKNKNNVDMIGSALSVPLLRSTILIEEPQEIAYQSVRKFRTQLLLWILGSAFIASLLGVFLSKQFSIPLNQLSEASIRLSLRDFSVVLPRGRKDEFGKLFSIHNEVAKELEKYETLNINRIIAERNKLETVVRQANDGILLCDAQKNIMMMNAVWAKWFGADISNEGQFLEDVLPNNEEFTSIVSDMLETQESLRSVEFRIRNSGNVKEIVLKGTMVKIQDNGDVIAHLTLLHDITQEVEIDRMKTELVAIVAHELRSPLNSINGLAELIGEGVLPKEEQEEFGRSIATQSKKLAGIISKFLDLNKMESGKSEIRRIPVRLDEILHSVISINKPLAEKKSINVRVVSTANVPPIIGDPDLLGQAVLNLFSNAVKYSEPNTEVWIELRTKVDEVVVSVGDEGYGISEESQKKLFTKFFRATEDERVRKNTGTGLGLAFVKEIAEQHGGKVGVESTLNMGSRFWFSIPL